MRVSQGSGGAHGDGRSAVRVCVRVRPLTQKEKEDGRRCIVRMYGDGKKTQLIDPAWYEERKKINERVAEETSHIWVSSFEFDRSFWSVDGTPEDLRRVEEAPTFARQEDVYEFVGTSVIAQARKGYNTSILAYGQTGAGKSYTMMGTGGAFTSNFSPEQFGLIPRIMHGLFQEMAQDPRDLKAGAKQESGAWQVFVSYLEIYNEQVRDLFVKKDGTVSRNCAQKFLRVREHPQGGSYAAGLTEHRVQNYEDVERLLIHGSNMRTVASTNMNDKSSRSHALFSVILKYQRGGLTIRSKIDLVDLAGSERAKLTGAEGERLKEAAKINQSLSELSKAIHTLAQLSEKGEKRHARSGSGSRASGFVQYRNSVLTKLLQDSLGGNAITTMIAAISPSDSHYKQTLTTLRYVQSAKNICTHATVNKEETSARRIAKLSEEVAHLRAKLAESAVPSLRSQLSGRVSGISGISETRNSDHTMELNEMREALTVLRSENEALRTSVSKAEEQYHGAIVCIAELRDEAAELRNEAEELRNEAQKLRRRHEVHEVPEATCNVREKQTSDAAQVLREEVSRLTAVMGAQDVEMGAMKRDLAKVRAENAALVDQCDQLKEDDTKWHASMAKFEAEAKCKLEAAAAAAAAAATAEVEQMRAATETLRAEAEVFRETVVSLKDENRALLDSGEILRQRAEKAEAKVLDARRQLDEERQAFAAGTRETEAQFHAIVAPLVASKQKHDEELRALRLELENTLTLREKQHADTLLEFEERLLRAQAHAAENLNQQLAQSRGGESSAAWINDVTKRATASIEKYTGVGETEL